MQGDTASIYAGESTLTDSGQNVTMVEKVIHFLYVKMQKISKETEYCIHHNFFHMVYFAYDRASGWGR